MKIKEIGNSNKIQLLEFFDKEMAQNLKRSTILVTGGTGFVGTWLMQGLNILALKYKLSIDVVLTSRNLEETSKHISWFQNLNISMLEIDFSKLSTLVSPPRNQFSHVINLATTAAGRKISPAFNLYQSSVNSLLWSHQVAGNSTVASPYLFNASSGAAGTVSPSEKILLDFLESGLEGNLNYAQAKRDSEFLLENQLDNSKIRSSSARLFTFYGPYFPLNGKYAITDFLVQAMQGNDIIIEGSPDTVRSYMHGVNLSQILIQSLSEQPVGVFEIGHPRETTISDLALMLSKKFNVNIHLNQSKTAIQSKYVPSDLTIQNRLLNGAHLYDLSEGLEDWKNWLMGVAD